MAGRGRVVVIGGGVIGVASAYYLARDGWTVTLVERDDVAAGSSWGNSGLVVPSHSIPLAAPGVLRHGLRWLLDSDSPFYVRPRLDPDLLRWLWRFRAACTPDHVRRAMPVLRDLSRASLALYRELARLDDLAFGWTERGVLAVFRTPAGLAGARHEAELLGDAGLPVRLLDGDEARALEPSLALGVRGALHFLEDAHLVPHRFVTGLAAIAERLGVQIRRRTPAVGVRMVGRRATAVETPGGDVEGDLIVLAAGSWSPGVGRRLGLRLPIQPAKGYSVTVRRPERSPALPLLLGEARVAVTPMDDRLRFGGTLELAGLDLTVNGRRVAAILRGARTYLDGVERLEEPELWRGLRPCTPDGLPLLGWSHRVDNLIVATGHAMVGMSLGPVTGKLVAQLAAGEPTLVDLGPLRPERFGP